MLKMVMETPAEANSTVPRSNKQHTIKGRWANQGSGFTIDER